MNIARASQQFLSRTPLLVRTALVYVFLAGTFMSAGVIIQRHTPAPIEVAVYTPPVTAEPIKEVIQGAPTRVQVERLGIDLPISYGYYNAETQEWTLDETQAFFATITDQPNDTRGSTFIYGHNRRSVFAPLSDVQVGDTVKISTDNGHVFTYTYARDASVTPDTTQILYEHPEPPQLVLMTCEGAFSATRRIMYFTLTGVNA